MGQCFLYGNGGGSQLFYDVKCQTAEPAKKEGRIWVKSSVAMTRFEFGNTWSGGSVGMVAIQGSVGAENPSATNNAIEVFDTKVAGIWNRLKVAPSGCRQVQGSTGNWVYVDAYVCHSNTWVQFANAWDGILYDSGNECTDFTGGWILSNCKSYSNYIGVEAVKPTNTWVSAKTTNLIDLTAAKTLNFTGNLMLQNSGGTNGGNFGLLDSSGNWAARAQTSGSTGTFSLDISGITGSYRPYAEAGNQYMGSYIRMTKMWVTF